MSAHPRPADSDPLPALPAWVTVIQPRTEAEAVKVRREIAEIYRRVRFDLREQPYRDPRYRSSLATTAGIAASLAATDWWQGVMTIDAMEGAAQ